MRLQLQKRTMHTAMLACAAFVLAAVGLVLLLCLRSGMEQTNVLAENDGWRVERKAPMLTGEEKIISRETMLRGTLLLVSPEHPLPADFPLPNTRSVRAMVGSYLPAQEDVALWQEAVYGLCAIQLEFPLEKGLSLVRGTLSAAQQEDWRREAFTRFSKIYPLKEALDQAIAAVPGGGESEHQTGYAVDIALKGPLSLGEAQPLLRNETGRWLHQNAWRYGWITRYASGQEAEGSCEGVHLRYVGTVHAAAMHTLNLGVEDYLALLRREEALTLYRNGEAYAYLYCAPVEGSWRLRLPAGAAAQFSLDNTGWAVAAVAAQGVF